MKYCTISIFLLLTLFVSVSNAQEASPFGVCAHLQGGEEHGQMPQNLQLMRKAGIRWVRADFSWSGVESPQGNWKFDHLDRVVDETKKHGIQVLPILNYDVKWATPAYKHLDLWLAYVEKVVTRYKDKIKYWEVWNEPNLEGFWREKPDGGNYKVLLEMTYKKIKQIDPNLVVLYGGTAGIPFDFIERSFEAGAGEYFDVFNIHPYRGGMNSVQAVDRYRDEIDRLRTQMGKYGVDHKKIWITEMGWATPPGIGGTNKAVLDAAKQILDPAAKEWSVAVLHDGNYPAGQAFSENALRALFPEGYRITFIKLPELKNIDPKKYQALFFPPSENYPTPFWNDIVNYVTKGGHLFLFGGVPIYYQTELSKDDPAMLVQKKGGAVDPDRRRLRIGWHAWWTDKDKKTPEYAKLAKADGAKEILDKYEIQGRGSRFLNDRLLKDGDKLIPILLGKEKDFEGICAGVFKFDSDMKGSVTVNTMMGEGVMTTEADQAVYLPQAILTSLRFGIERYFWYEFQAPERDRLDKEHHFGIVHQQLEPKPAWHAYAALGRVCPEGSVIDTSIEWNRGNFCVVSWKHKNGTRVWALWSPAGERTVSVTIGKGLHYSIDHLGLTLPLTEATKKLTIGPGMTYMVGPPTLEVK